MKTTLTLYFTLFLSLTALTSRSIAQTIHPDFFGINYWLDTQVENFGPELQQANLKMIRIGGNKYNHDWKHPTDYEDAIEWVKSLNMEPIVQVPISLTPNELSDLIAHFDDITYYMIGNEPDPADNPATGSNEPLAWFNGGNDGGYTFEGYDYHDWLIQYRQLAYRLKTDNEHAKLIGPDFRLFYNQVIDTYYEHFLNDLTDDKLPNGGPYILDYLSFHFYEYKDEATLDGRFNKLMGYVNAANSSAGRTGSDEVRIAVTEVNTKAQSSSPVKPWEFSAGHFLMLMTKKAMEKEALCVLPWSVYENNGSQGNTDFGLFGNDGPGTFPRSTMVHLDLLSTNRKVNVMKAEIENDQSGYAAVLAMRDYSGYVFMVMNRSLSSVYSYRASLDNTYKGSEMVRIKLEGYANHSGEYSGYIGPRSTHMWVLDANGQPIKRYEYNQGDLNSKTGAREISLNNLHNARIAEPVETKTTEESISIYPNPVTSELSIKGVNGPATLTLYNVGGKVILEKAFSEDLSISTESYPEGIYQLRIKTGDQTIEHKIVKN